MVAKIDRTGETGINNFGSKMVIIRYENAMDIDIYFSEYNWTAKNKQYSKFKKGSIICPYERRVYGVGYIGEGKYKVSDKNGKNTKCYKVWASMLQRCYDSKYHKRESTYINCEVVKEWNCYQNFAEWFYDNYYEIEGQKMALDKDILNKGNKIYSPNNCIFVPQIINNLFVKQSKIKFNYPIGVSYNKDSNKFSSRCRIYDFKENKTKQRYLGLYDSPEQAFQAYKEFKEKHIKKVAEYYKEQISEELYQAMYSYKVEIDD